MPQHARDGHRTTSRTRTRTIGAALAGALAAATLGAGLAQADGGVADPGTQSSTDGTYAKMAFGKRNLAYGMRGTDVKVLNWLLRSVRKRSYVPYKGEFQSPTDRTVRAFQSEVGLNVDGVVARPTRKAIARRMKVRMATWYGPGFWGNRTACGRTLRKHTIGVAHKTLPCGTRVTFAYRGRFVRARVIDRGPYRHGYQWDLTRRVAKRLGFLSQGAGKLRVAIVPNS